MTKSKNENSYRSILKGISAFGGVQVFQILINLIRGKFVAMFLGPAGMGVSALFTTTATTIQQFSSLGLNLAIVKEVAASRDNPGSLSTALGVGRRLIYTTAFLGAIACLVLSRFLSRATFGDESYTGWFALLSLMIFFAVAGAGELSLLQGLHAVKRLSLASLVGASAGLLFGIPLYWLFGVSGIVPAMIILSLSTFIFYLHSVRSETKDCPGARFAWNEHRPLVRKLIALGLLLMSTTLIGSLVNWLIATFIRANGSVDTVGLYQAANSLTNQYVGMVFAAMSLDYFPRLSAAASDNRAVRDIANRQTEIASLLATPLIVLLIVSSPLIIRILLTESFLSVTPLMRWMGFGILFRALMFPLGSIAFAKDDRKLFFWLEGIAGNALTLGFSLVLFHIFGLTGLGAAVLADCALCLLIYYIVNRRRYGFRYSGRSLRCMFFAVACGASAFGCSFIATEWLSYTLMGLILAISITIGSAGLLRLIRSDKKAMSAGGAPN